MTGRPALFPEPPPDLVALSAALAGPEHRVAPGQVAKWTRINTKTIDCLECAYLQHETRGAFGPRRQAKRRRTSPRGVRMELCRAHAQAWQVRDENDGRTPKGGAA